MKKYLLLLLFLLFITLTSAAQYGCPEQAQIISSSEEIDEGRTKTVLSIPLGICAASENSYYEWIESTIFIDANLISLDNNQTKGTELISGNDSISYRVILSDTQVSLKIDSSEEELELDDCSEIGGLVAMIKSINNGGPPVEVLVATNKITLNTRQNPSEIIEFNSKKYAIELLAGSYSGSTIKVSTCSSGDIYELPEVIPVQNQTISVTNASNNETITNQTEINQTQNTAQNNTINQTILNEINQTCTSDSECSTNYCKNSLCAKKGIFKSIFDWFKGLF